MTGSTFKDPFAFPYSPALSSPAEYFFTEGALVSFARQPAPPDNVFGHGNTGGRHTSGDREDVEDYPGVYSSLGTHSPYLMDSGEMSPVMGDERSIQPEESVLPSASATERALREFIRIPADLPVALSSLNDISNPLKIPNLTHLAALAIWSSPQKRMKLSEIYDAIEARYPVLQTNREKKWKESLRHRLSLKAIFVRVGQAERGSRGGYWALDVSKGMNENKRHRKQGSGGGTTSTPSPGPKTDALTLSDRDDYTASDYSDYSHSSTSLSPPAPHDLNVSPTLNYLTYQFSGAHISRHGSPSGSSPEIGSAYSPDNMLLHDAAPLGYSSTQASTPYFSSGNLDYDQHHSLAPPSVNVSEHFFDEPSDLEGHESVERQASGSNIRMLPTRSNSYGYEPKREY